MSIGAAMLGSPHVIGIDIDDDALQIAQENCDQFEGLQVIYLGCRVTKQAMTSHSMRHHLPSLLLFPPLSVMSVYVPMSVCEMSIQAAYTVQSATNKLCTCHKPIAGQMNIAQKRFVADRFSTISMGQTQDDTAQPIVCLVDMTDQESVAGRVHTV